MKARRIRRGTTDWEEVERLRALTRGRVHYLYGSRPAIENMTPSSCAPSQPSIVVTRWLTRTLDQAAAVAAG